MEAYWQVHVAKGDVFVEGRIKLCQTLIILKHAGVVATRQAISKGFKTSQWQARSALMAGIVNNDRPSA